MQIFILFFFSSVLNMKKNAAKNWFKRYIDLHRIE
jgi:hypothetical protein